MPGTSFPSINALNITEFGVFKLLDKIDVSKASGPDCIPGRILQNLARELAPVLHYIFDQSLNSGDLPADWTVICNSDFGILNWDTPTRLPSNATPSSPDVSLASSSLITSTNWNTITTLGSDHLPILIRLQTTVSVTPASHRTYVNLKKANWARFTQEIEDKLSNRPLPSDCQKDEKTLRAIILKAASHHIPTGRHKINTEPVPAEILDLTKERDELRQRDHTSPELQRLNEEITRTTTAHKQAKWKQFVETMDHKTDSSKLWRTIKAIDGKSTTTAENEAIVFNEKPTSSPKDIANKFNKQFTTSKLGIHSSSHETRYVSREARKKSQETAPTFTTAMVTSAIKSCSNSRAFGPDLLSIFHLKNLGPKATEYLTALFNDSFKSSRIPSIWKTSLVIPILKPGKDSSQGTSYRPISLLCPAAKVMEALILPEVNYHLLPSPDQHGFRLAHSTTSALLQLTTDIATGFNQRKPPDRTACVAVDLTAAFDTVCHNTLIPRLQDLHFRHLPPDGCHATSVVDKQEPAAEESNQVQGLSTQASLKDQSCHHRYSAST